MKHKISNEKQVHSSFGSPALKNNQNEKKKKQKDKTKRIKTNRKKSKKEKKSKTRTYETSQSCDRVHLGHLKKKN